MNFIRIILFSVVFITACDSAKSDLPASFDLRNVDGSKFVSAVKSQSGGTCWTHGTMAAMEGNLLLHGAWQANGEDGEPNLAEYHLDWWNGFNKHNNPDIAPKTGGLTVHQGGDYLLAAAYLSRAGAVRDLDGQSYSNPPQLKKDSYHYYYARDIEWLGVGDDLSKIGSVKKALMDNGVVGTALTWSNSFYSSSRNTFYQPKSSSADPNHAVAIVGWDDNKETQAPQKGAWLVKNSWGSGWGDGGYFWISYYDKIAGHHATMGAISFTNVEPFKYSAVYYHDVHGWRDTLTESNTALNVFKVGDKAQTLSAVGLYTAADGVDYSVEIYEGFLNGQPQNLVASTWGQAEHRGYHTVDIPGSRAFVSGSTFAVLVRLSAGGQPFDRSSEVPVLLCGSQSYVWVESSSSPGQSYYLKDSTWVDLKTKDESANFTIRAFMK